MSAFICNSLKDEWELRTRSSALAVIADHSVKYAIATEQTIVWNSQGQCEYLLIYSFNFQTDVCYCFWSFWEILWLNDIFYSKVSAEISRKCPAGNMTLQFATSYTDPEWHNTHRYRQTDNSIMPRAAAGLAKNAVLRVLIGKERKGGDWAWKGAKKNCRRRQSS